MKSKDLLKYKPLDITQISGSPWNDAETVLGLDSNKDLVMAETSGATDDEHIEEVVDARIEELDLPSKNWVRGHTNLAIEDAMDEEVARVADGYYNKNEVADGYYNKNEVDDLIDSIDVTDQLTNYYTKSQVDAAISGATEDLATEQYVDNAIASETGRTEDVYVKKTVLPYAYDNISLQPETTGGTGGTQSISCRLRNSTNGNTGFTRMYAKSINGEHLLALEESGATNIIVTTPEDLDDAMSAETARTESTYLKTHQNIKTVNGNNLVGTGDVLLHTGVTQAEYNALQTKEPGVLYCITDANGITVDDELDIESTNPVENGVVTAALNGVTATTELTILETDSTWQLNDALGNQYYFKNTSIEKYKALYLGNLALTANTYFYVYIINPGGYWLYSSPSTNVQTSNVGTLKYYLDQSGGGVWCHKSNLDGTFEYYIILNTEELWWMVYKTLPASFSEVSDHKANLSDIPVAQDKSDVKYYVYNNVDDSNKRVVRNISTTLTYSFTNINRILRLQTQFNFWGTNSGNNAIVVLQPGCEAIPGVKTSRDTGIINGASEALEGFEEQLTLTIGSASTDTINVQWNDVYFNETNDPRYLVYDLSSNISTNSCNVQNLSLSGTTYYILNNPNFFDRNYSVAGKYQLATYRNSNNGVWTIGVPSGVHYYLILDKEQLTLELAESLTITRKKNIADAFNNYYTKAEVDALIQQLLQSLGQ